MISIYRKNTFQDEIFCENIIIHLEEQKVFFVEKLIIKLSFKFFNKK